jgi:solute carrier family 25 carnitine/acylcarnitine transporter 20/29
MGDKSKSNSHLSAFIGGTLAGWAKVIVGQPFDIVKVRLANSTEPTSAVKMLTGIIRQEGVLTLWRGSLPPFIGVGIFTSILFGSYNNFKKRLQPDPLVSIAYWKYYACGFAAGMCNTIVSIPTEGLRIRRQVQGRVDPRGDPHYKSDLDCMVTVFKNHGLKGWYKGSVSTIIRDSFGFGTYFCTYEILVDNTKPPGGSIADLHPFTLFCFGGFSGIILWTIWYPTDAVKSRIQGDSLANPRYSSLKDCVSQMFRNEGFKSFYRGYTPCLLRAFPVNASMWLTYELYGRFTKRLDG